MVSQGTIRPLSGIRVIAVDQVLAGPFAAMMLADFGAEVIKVEMPGSGDVLREVGSARVNERGQRVTVGIIRHNRNKKSLTLDLTKPNGQEVFKQLVKVADIVIENFRPGVMDSFGLGWATLQQINPHLIYVSLSGFGHRDIYQSPYWDRAAFDMVSQAMSGLMYLPGNEGDPPMWMGFNLGDQYAGLLAAYSILLALRHRDHTGEGQHIDIALYDSAVSLNERVIAEYCFSGQRPERGHYGFGAPYGPFQVKDGYIVIAVLHLSMWQRLARLIGRDDLADDPRLATSAARRQHLDDIVQPAMDAWLKDKTKQEAVELLAKAGVAAGPVQTVEEVVQDPHLAARHMLIETHDPIAGTVRVVGDPIKFSRIPEPESRPAPMLGEHTEEVLKGLLGLSDERIQQLRQEGAI